MIGGELELICFTRIDRIKARSDADSTDILMESVIVQIYMISVCIVWKTSLSEKVFKKYSSQTSIEFAAVIDRSKFEPNTGMSSTAQVTSVSRMMVPGLKS